MNTLIAHLDRVVSRFGVVNALVNGIADRMLPQATAQAGLGSCCTAYTRYCSEACVYIAGNECGAVGKTTRKYYYTTSTGSCGAPQCGCLGACC